MGFSVFVDQYDVSARRPYRDVYQSAVNTGTAAPFELALGALVPGASFCVNSTQRQVKYAGDGRVSTHDVLNAVACATSLSGLTITPTAPVTLYTNNGALNVAWSGGFGPLTVRVALMAPGVEGTPAYAETLTRPAGTQTAVFPSDQASTVVQVRDRHYTYPPLGLAPGRYRVEVLEETGGIIAAEITLTPTHNLTITAADPTPAAGETLLGLTLQALGNSQVQLDGYIFVPTDGTVRYTSLIGAAGDYADIAYFLPIGTVVANFNGSPTFYSNGQGGVTPVVIEAVLPRVELSNLIHFHPDRPGENTGGIIVEVHSFANRAVGVVAFALLDSTGATLATNITGRFGALPAGSYTVQATQGFTTLRVPVTLVARYGLKWRLSFPDLYAAKTCRVELWARDYRGPVLTLCGDTDNPVTLETEGFAGGNTQPDLPAVIGSSATLRLRAAPGALVDLLADDRAGRADIYYDGALQFSGYLQPDIYEEPMLGDTVAVSLTATDGLAALRDVDFAGHVGQELRGRRPILNTLLHCLSRTDLALPLGVFTNRRALEMSTDEQPETDLYTDRLAYAEAGKPLPQRAVLDALCVLLGGTLVQRGGRWEIRAALEAAAPVNGRAYDAAGSTATAQLLASPAGRVSPAQTARADAGLAGPLYWQAATQHRQRRAGWRFLTASGDATFTENALRQGEYFGDSAAWDASGTALLPTAGWVPGERSVLPATAFPLQLRSAGEGDTDLATQWPPRTSNTDGRYLESELGPLAAGIEGVPIEITVQAKWLTNDNPTAATFKESRARIWVELVGVEDGGIALRTSGAVLSFAPAENLAAGFTTATVRLNLPVLPGTVSNRIRVHAYTYTTRLRARDTADGSDTRAGVLLIKSVAVRAMPQGASWKAADGFFASGAGGSVRPPDMAVFHIDAPQRAGLFGGVAHAFLRSVTRTVADSPATQWARADDVRPAPLLASAVLDVLALRANPSQVLVGTVAHTRRPPEALDAIDTPYDAAGRRFAVGARTWDVRPGTSTVSLVEIGAGEYLVLPTLPPKVQLVHGLTSGRVRILLSRRGGVRAIH